MEKPIVFLSHSSKDKEDLTRLKDLLDKRAAGSIEFFLSSDGQSIRLGTNWVARISDALGQAKLMFLFLTPDSADSKWIHFEAGHANAKGIQVVPVCLPGMDLGRMTPPLGLLQGFNLHSHDALGNLARVCNEAFELKLNEKFDEDDFKEVFVEQERRIHGPFGEYLSVIKEITAEAFVKVDAKEQFDPLTHLSEVATRTAIKHRMLQEARAVLPHGFEILGCIGRVSDNTRPTPNRSPVIKDFMISCRFSPKTFHMSAKFVGVWHELAFPDQKWKVEVHFDPNINSEEVRSNLTGKLFGSQIELNPDGKLVYCGTRFELTKHQFHNGPAFPVLECLEVTSLEHLPLREIISRLFKAEILMESYLSPDYPLLR